MSTWVNPRTLTRRLLNAKRNTLNDHPHHEPGQTPQQTWQDELYTAAAQLHDIEDLAQVLNILTRHVIYAEAQNKEHAMKNDRYSLNDNGTINEIILTNANVHLEQMNHFDWMLIIEHGDGINGTGQHFHLNTQNVRPFEIYINGEEHSEQEWRDTGDAA